MERVLVDHDPHRVRRLLAMGLACLPGVALVLYPMFQDWPGPELQEHFPRNAIVALVQHDWRPFGLLHGALLFDVLRVLYTFGYVVARAGGVVQDRLDVLAAFVTDPFPFIVVGRAVIASAAVCSLGLSIVLAGRLAAAPAAAAGAALLLGTMVVQVREAHHIWLDLPAGCAALAATLAALRLLDRPSLAAAALAGAAAGLTLAAKHSAFPIAVTVACAALLAPGRGRTARLATVAAAMLAVFVLLSPYVVLEARATFEMLRMQGMVTFAPVRRGLPLGELVGLGIGWPACALAVVGLGVSAFRRPRHALVAASFPVLALVVLAPAQVTFLRYLAPTAPFVAVFAAVGAAALAARVAPRWAASLTLALTLAAAFPQARESLAHVRVLGWEDTRVTAGRWIRAHVPPGTPMTLPDATGYPNPVLPPDRLQLDVRYPRLGAALAARGLADPARIHPMRYLSFFDRPAGGLDPLPRWVVTAEHPVILAPMNATPETLDRLRAAGARPVARFTGIDGPPSPDTRWDPIDADYPPLRGAAAITAPGPNLTVWEIPGVDGR